MLSLIATGHRFRCLPDSDLTSSQIERKAFNLKLCHGVEIPSEFHVKVMLLKYFYDRYVNTKCFTTSAPEQAILIGHFQLYFLVCQPKKQRRNLICGFGFAFLFSLSHLKYRLVFFHKNLTKATSLAPRERFRGYLLHPARILWTLTFFMCRSQSCGARSSSACAV